LASVSQAWHVVWLAGAYALQLWSGRHAMPPQSELVLHATHTLGFGVVSQRCRLPPLALAHCASLVHGPQLWLAAVQCGAAAVGHSASVLQATQVWLSPLAHTSLPLQSPVTLQATH